MPSNPVFQSDEPDLRDNDYNRHPRSRTLDADFRNVQDEISGRLKRKENAVEMDIVPGQRRRASFVGNFPNLTVKVEKDDGSVDPWSLPELRPDGSPWKDLSGGEKCKRIAFGVLKFLGVLILLYFFVISLDLLSSSFRLLGGRVAGRTFQESELLSNPVVGLMIGVLVTVVVQSSSTSSSITIAMVSSGMLDVSRAIYIIMGANVGTTITNTLVSLAQSADRAQFRRAFAGATIHDMFNWLTVAILLPLEVATGYLAALTGAILRSWNPQRDSGGNVELLTAITKPLTHLVIQLNSKVIEEIASGNPDAMNRSMIKEECATKSTPNRTCIFLFHNTGLGETNTGLIVLAISLALLCMSLIGIVKILNSILKGTMANALKRALNTDIPSPFSFLTGYVAMAIGAGVTFIIQSSSVFTSALTPLVGLGVVSLERMYPLTLGSNIGTTGTGLLAAMAADPKSLKAAVQVALCHLFFNITGILIWYPIPWMRRVPILLAKLLGGVTAKHRWFAIVYIVIVFLVIPACIVALTLAGKNVFIGVSVPFLILVIFIVAVNILQQKFPRGLPRILRTWNFLPLWMHSLAPYDICFQKLACCGKCCSCCQSNELVSDTVEKPEINGSSY